jgi:hypothetical protein
MMLVTRPFTNEEVADRLEDVRTHLSTASKLPEHAGLIAEACRRLRGQLPSGSHPVARVAQTWRGTTPVRYLEEIDIGNLPVGTELFAAASIGSGKESAS